MVHGHRYAQYFIVTGQFMHSGVQYIMSNTLLWDLASSDPQTEKDTHIIVETALGNACAADPTFLSSGTRQRQLRSEARHLARQEHLWHCLGDEQS